MHNNSRIVTASRLTKRRSTGTRNRKRRRESHTRHNATDFMQQMEDQAKKLLTEYRKGMKDWHTLITEATKGWSRTRRRFFDVYAFGLFKSLETEE